MYLFFKVICYWSFLFRRSSLTYHWMNLLEFLLGFIYLIILNRPFSFPFNQFLILPFFSSHTSLIKLIYLALIIYSIKRLLHSHFHFILIQIGQSTRIVIWLICSWLRRLKSGFFSSGLFNNPSVQRLTVLNIS